ncbi:MAG: helix-turn-helix transcriptional regulator [Actinomycetota bacterium]|nr:helix-turn-helix transcriptional regulator [Actinomycetota bacterium]
MLVIALWLSLWLASGSLVLAIADGLGPHPARRLLIGLLAVSVSAAALWRRENVAAWLRARPWSVLPLAAVQLSAAVIDGLIGGPYVAFSMTSIALAVVVARARTVWLCVALLAAGYALAITLDHTPTALVRSGDLSGVLGAMLGYPFAALAGLWLVRLFARFLANVEPTLQAMREGGPALTTALAGAIERGGNAPPGLPPVPTPARPARPVALTATERRVVEALASGTAPKELAYAWGVSLSTVRTHIKHAKRKTGARTLTELAAMTSRWDRPDVHEHAS